MREVILLLSETMNQIHDMIMFGLGVNMTDKQMHFWVIGFIGLVTFLVGYVLIKIIQKLKFSTTILSFLFTFVLMTVFVFAIEIQQAVTSSGNMEFADAIAGLWGFIVFFAVYAVIAGVFYGLFRLFKRKRQKRRQRKNAVQQPSAPQPSPSPAATVEKKEETVRLTAEPEQPIKYRSELRKQKENQ